MLLVGLLVLSLFIQDAILFGLQARGAQGVGVWPAVSANRVCFEWLLSGFFIYASIAAFGQGQRK